MAAEYDVVVVDRESAAVTDAARKRTEFVTEEDIDDLESRWGAEVVVGHVFQHRRVLARRGVWRVCDGHGHWRPGAQAGA